MSGDSSYRVELAFTPDGSEDTRPYRARIYNDNGDAIPLTTVYGSSRESALLHAREWIKTRSTHGQTEEFFLDASGDLITQPDGHSVRVPS